MSNIPRSYWKLEKVYFKAKLVDGFKEKYIEWYTEGSYGSLTESQIHNLLADAKDFCDLIANKKHVELYQFPNDFKIGSSDEECDYFEREDDDHVIPYHLFTLVEELIWI